MERPELTAKDREWRYQRVRQFLKAKGLSAILVTGDPFREGHVRYFTGQYFRIGAGAAHVLLPLEGEPTLFWATPEREYVLLGYHTFIKDYWVNHTKVLSIDNLAGEFTANGLAGGVVGLTLDTLSVNQFNQLKQRLPQTQFVDVSRDFIGLRQVKSEGEIALARESARIVDLCWERLAAEAKPGMREHEITALMEATMWRANTDKTFNLTCSAKQDLSRPCWPSAHSPNVVKDGDLLLAEITASYGGYWTQKVSLYSFGTPGSLAQDLFRACELAHNKAVELIRPGANAKDIVTAIDRSIQDAGFLSPSQFPTGPHGHLMGLDVDEGTFLPGTDFTLETGMVMAIHPGAAIPGWTVGQPGIFGPGSAYVVTKDGVESLNKTPNNLVVIA